MWNNRSDLPLDQVQRCNSSKFWFGICTQNLGILRGNWIVFLFHLNSVNMQHYMNLSRQENWMRAHGRGIAQKGTQKGVQVWQGCWTTELAESANLDESWFTRSSSDMLAWRVSDSGCEFECRTQNTGKWRKATKRRQSKTHWTKRQKRQSFYMFVGWRGVVSHVSHVSHVDVFGFNALSSTTRLLCAWWSFFMLTPRGWITTSTTITSIWMFIDQHINSFFRHLPTTVVGHSKSCSSSSSTFIDF